MRTIYTLFLFFFFLSLTVSSIYARDYGYVAETHQSDSCFKHQVNIYDANGNPTVASTLYVGVYDTATRAIILEPGTLTNVSSYTTPCLSKSLGDIYIQYRATKPGFGQVEHNAWDARNSQNSSNGVRLDVSGTTSIYFTAEKTISMIYPTADQYITTKTIIRKMYAKPRSGGDIDYIWDEGLFSVDGSGNWTVAVPSSEYGSEASPYNATPDASGFLNLPITVTTPLDGYYTWATLYLDQDPPIITNVFGSRESKYWSGDPFYSYFYLATDLLANTPKINGTLTPGSNLTFSDVIKNNSAEIIARASTTRFRLDINNDGTWDTTLGTSSVNQLNAGATQTNTSPSWTAVNGIHKIEVCADYANFLIDINRGNNCSTRIFTVGTPTSTPVPATPTFTATPTKIPTFTKTPTPTPTAITNRSCNQTCTGSSQCASGYCYIGACRNVSCSTSTTCSCVVPTFTPTDTPTPTPTSVPTCNFDLLLPSNSLTVGSSPQTLIASNITTSSGASINHIEFTSSDDTIASVNPTIKSSPTYATAVSGNSVGSGVTISANMYLGTSATPTCTDTSTINVTGTAPWWQLKNSDVITNGSLISNIPASCTASAGCNNTLGTYETDQFPGVVIAGNTINPATLLASNNPPYGWQASLANYNGTIYTYDYFEKKATCGDIKDFGVGVNTISLTDIQSLGASSDGSYWIRYDGALGGPLITLNGNLDVGSNKIILYVKNADLLINSKITVGNQGLFMVIADQNIMVGPTVGGPYETPAIPDLEGIFFANQQFRTGTTGLANDIPLHIKGSIVAFDKIVLERNLSSNDTTPAELLEYGPEQVLTMPACLGEQSIRWGEVAP
jgi:hypothetical protein